MIDTILFWTKEEHEIWDIVAELSPSFHLWFVSEAPSERLKISSHYEQIAFYFKEQILFTPEIQTGSLLPGLFYIAAQRSQRPLSSCLLVTPNQRSATLAVNHGLNAIIFVDAFRLRREFKLRGLLP